MAKAKEQPLGVVIDALYRARELRLDREREVEGLKRQEKELRGLIIAALRKSGLDGARGEVAFGSIVAKRTVRLTTPDAWPEFWAWARKDPLGSYVQRRVAVEAVREQLDAGKKVPGVELEEFDDLSLTKAAAR